MKEDHEPGRCDACHQQTMVRWKNLYTKGSEGTWLCQPCESTVCNLINSMSMDAMLTKKRQIIDAKIKRNREAAKALKEE